MDLVNVSIKGSRFYSTFRNVFISKIKRFNVLRKYFHLNVRQIYVIVKSVSSEDLISTALLGSTTDRRTDHATVTSVTISAMPAKKNQSIFGEETPSTRVQYFSFLYTDQRGRCEQFFLLARKHHQLNTSSLSDSCLNFKAQIVPRFKR